MSIEDYNSYISNIKNIFINTNNVEEENSNLNVKLYENIYSKIKPINLKGNALICSTRCSMDIIGDRRENGMILTNNGLLNIEGSSSTTVSGSVQSELNNNNKQSNYKFYKILFFIPQFHQINSVINKGEIHIIFKDSNSEKYQVNCILFNENTDNNNISISEKLMDEYVYKNIPDKSKGQKKIIKSDLNWYLTDLLPNNQSYYSYVLPDNNNILMVLYEKPILLSSDFIDKLKNMIYKNNYTIKYGELNNNSALFYTYDSMTNKNNQSKNIKTISETENINESFNDDTKNTENNTTIIYENTKTSEDLQKIIEEKVKNSEILEHNSTQYIEYDSNTKNKEGCKKDKSIGKTVLSWLFWIFNLFLIISFIIILIIKRFRSNIEFKEEINGNMILDNIVFYKKFINMFFGDILKEHIKKIGSISILIILTLILISIYLYSSNVTLGLTISSFIFYIITIFIIISGLIYMWSNNLSYIISKDNKNGIYEQVKNYNNLYLGFTTKQTLSNSKILEDWIKEVKEKTVKNLYESIYTEILQSNNESKDELTKIEKLKKDIRSYVNNIRGLSISSLRDNISSFFKNKEEKISDLNNNIYNELYEKFKKITNIDNFLGSSDWNTIIDNETFKIENNKDNIKTEFIIKIKNLLVELEDENDIFKQEFEELKKKYEDLLKTNLSIPPPPQTQLIQLGGSKKQKLYEEKEIKNTKTLKRILKELRK